MTVAIQQNVLLTGSSGTIGRAVLSQLLQTNKYKITCFLRPTQRNRRLFRKFRSTVKVVFGDISKYADVEKLTDRFDIAIHLAAVIPPLADINPESTRGVNTEGTAHLIQVLEMTSPNVFFMFSSSIAVYGDRLTNPIITVSDSIPILQNHVYADSKINAERFIQNCKLKWTIFRLTAIMGANNHKISKLMFHMPLATKIEIATPGDAARAFVNGIDKKEKLVGKLFNLGGGENCRTTYYKFLERTFTIVGLGSVNFHQMAFAEKNFHCGYLADGDILEDIVQFRSESLEDFYQMTKRSLKPIQKPITWLFKGIIKRYLQNQSEPLQAYLNQDRNQISRFF